MNDVRERIFCKTHYLYYFGQECPYCRNERIATLVKKYVKPTTEKKEPEAENLKDKYEELVKKYNTKN